MAGASLLTLLDDITSVLDDVAAMSKLAIQKTAGVVGDDLALNAQQIVGVRIDRELPVVWSVAKGSILNKAILVPIALTVGTVLPKVVVPLLMLGGAYLCYEGFEKIVHKFMKHNVEEDSDHHQHHLEAITHPETDLVALERGRIRGAIRTDFILSAEIIVITLGTVAGKPFLQQVGVLVTIAVLMTIGVYGLVAVIIKLDDFGRLLTLRTAPGLVNQTSRATGRLILRLAPYLLRFLSVAGTVAMFMVGGGILTHGFEAIHHDIEELAHQMRGIWWIGDFLEFLTAGLLNAIAGVVAGAVLLAVVTLVERLKPQREATV